MAALPAPGQGEHIVVNCLGHLLLHTEDIGRAKWLACLLLFGCAATCKAQSLMPGRAAAAQAARLHRSAASATTSTFVFGTGMMEAHLVGLAEGDDESRAGGAVCVHALRPHCGSQPWEE